jgi:peroxiredoxin
MLFRYKLGSLIITSALLLSACGGEDSSSQTNNAVYTPKHGSALINTAATSFSVNNLQGGKISLSDYQGKVVLINFWATWCAPCRAEMPDFVEVYSELSTKDFTILGIALDEKTAVSEFVKKIGVNYPIAYGEDDVAKITQEYGNTMGGLPYNVILDKQHRIIYAEPGPIPKDRLQKLVEPLL